MRLRIHRQRRRNHPRDDSTVIGHVDDFAPLLDAPQHIIGVLPKLAHIDQARHS
jgi:hypothetical protein